MRYLRIALLTDFFLKKKNFERANKIINFGIFLAIFALTSSIISFVIERKINQKEYELTLYQNEVNQIQVLGSWMKNHVYYYFQDQEQQGREYANELYNNETNSSFKLLSSDDFYKPYTYFVAKENQIIEDYLKEENWVKEFKTMLNDFEEDEIVKRWRENFNEFEKKTRSFEKNINLKDYNLNNFLTSKEEIFDEIKNLESASDLDSESQSRYDYVTAFGYKYSVAYLFETIIEMLDIGISSSNDEMKILSDEIIRLSKLEKNLILSTFALQFVIFLIIQLFEISSITREKRIKLL